MSAVDPVSHCVAVTSICCVKLCSVTTFVLCVFWLSAVSKRVYQLWVVGTAALIGVGVYDSGECQCNDLEQKCTKISQWQLERSNDYFWLSPFDVSDSCVHY